LKGHLFTIACFSISAGGRLISALQLKRKSAFSLEKEVVQKKINSTTAFLAIILVLFVGQLTLVSVASGALPGLIH
jgi:hypothetical protein